jgi:hypothetical protein
VVGTLKQECFNHLIVLNENHARRIFKSYLEYYHEARTHLGLKKDTPDGRAVEPPSMGCRCACRTRVVTREASSSRLIGSIAAVVRVLDENRKSTTRIK